MSCSSCSSNNNPNDCSHDCSSCGESSCASREAEQQQCSHDCSSCSEQCAPPKVDQNVYSNIKHVIGVVSGKGGVGKSMVTCSMAAAMTKLGYKTAVLDADITGPSVPRVFGITQKARGCEKGLLPSESKNGVKIMSLNLVTRNETDPVVWRGPVIAGVVKQFWTDVYWGDIDYMFVDMPPGTGDVPLTVFQSLPVDTIIVVTSPQDLVSMIVTKALKMAQIMEVPVLGLVENFAYFQCPDCGKKHEIFGKSHIEKVATENHVPVLARLPIDPNLAAACDTGKIEEMDTDYLADTAKMLASLLP
ncbi:MAG: Mrp/NBP35 family ATP-binding protein [Candidatus Onthomonas sp.]|nr:Mrp/NBP35 family ATP-binding protein [Candidatus Onthomonas sp.]